MRIGNVALEDLPGVPQSYRDAHRERRALRAGELEEYKFFKLNKHAVIRGNSGLVFGDNYSRNSRKFF